MSTAYDGFGEPVSSTTMMGGVSRTLAYAHDANGNRTRVTHPDGVPFDTGHDGLDRPVLGTLYGAQLWRAGYDARGPRTLLEGWTNGSYSDLDALGRLQFVSQNFADGSHNQYTYFARNPAGQIVWSQRTNEQYSWTGHGDTDRAYAVDGLNRPTQAGGLWLAHDANGNLVSDGVRSYGYDAENRLVSGSGGVALAYDPLGRLHRVSGLSGATEFLWDGDEPVAEHGAGGCAIPPWACAPQRRPAGPGFGKSPPGFPGR